MNQYLSIEGTIIKAASIVAISPVFNIEFTIVLLNRSVIISFKSETPFNKMEDYRNRIIEAVIYNPDDSLLITINEPFALVSYVAKS